MKLLGTLVLALVSSLTVFASLQAEARCGDSVSDIRWMAERHNNKVEAQEQASGATRSQQAPVAKSVKTDKGGSVAESVNTDEN